MKFKLSRVDSGCTDIEKTNNEIDGLSKKKLIAIIGGACPGISKLVLSKFNLPKKKNLISVSIFLYVNLQFKKISLISIHSFTKKIGNVKRGIEIGLLWNKNMNLLIPIQKKLIDNNIFYGRNFPYSGFHFNYTLDRHSHNGLIDNIFIEIRNDLICSKKRIKKYTEMFTNIFSLLLK